MAVYRWLSPTKVTSGDTDDTCDTDDICDNADIGATQRQVESRSPAQSSTGQQQLRPAASGLLPHSQR
jgi:hypothetical protein